MRVSIIVERSDDRNAGGETPHRGAKQTSVNHSGIGHSASLSQSTEAWRKDGINHLVVQSPAANGTRQTNEMSDQRRIRWLSTQQPPIEFHIRCGVQKSVQGPCAYIAPEMVQGIVCCSKRAPRRLNNDIRSFKQQTSG